MLISNGSIKSRNSNFTYRPIDTNRGKNDGSLEDIRILPKGKNNPSKSDTPKLKGISNARSMSVDDEVRNANRNEPAKNFNKVCRRYLMGTCKANKCNRHHAAPPHDCKNCCVFYNIGKCNRKCKRNHHPECKEKFTSFYRDLGYNIS